MPGGRNPIILFLAIGSGVIAFLMTLQVIRVPQNNNATPQKGQPSYVTAIRDVGMGAIIKKDDVDMLAPSGSVNTKMVYADLSHVVGKVARRGILKGEVIKQVDILAEGDNLASLIPKGYRAMTVPVMLASNIRDLLQIGSRVDVILTYEATHDEIKSVTLVENARVIGISEPKTGAGSNSRIDVTLAVTPDGAETLAYATKRGTLNVSIRSLSEEDDEKFFTLKELFFAKEETKKEIRIQNEPQVPKDVIEVIRGVRKERYAADGNM